MSFSEKQLSSLQRNVAQRNIRTRAVGGKELPYVEGWYAISAANRIFGFDGWDRETLDAKCVLTRETRGSCLAVYTARVRVIVRTGDRTIVRDGHGTGEGRGNFVGEAHNLALKAAETDATKRALVTFGKAFGLALYARERGKQENERTTRPARPIEVGAVTGSEVLVAADSSDARGVEQRNDTQSPAGLKQSSPSGVHDHPASNGAPVAASGRSAEALDDRDSGQQGDHIVKWGLSTESLRSGHDSRGSLSSPKATDGAHASAIEGRVDKSVLTLGEPRRVRDKEHLRNVARQPCLLCSARPADAHHVRFAQPRALGRKVGDEFTVPLCREHHRDLHHSGNEAAWWRDMGIDAIEIAKQLWAETNELRQRPAHGFRQI
jgi:hypothetical protein